MRVARLFFCTAVLLLLFGCFDYNELNMQELVSGVGIDADGDGVSVIVQCAATSGEESEKGAVYKASGKSFFDAVRNITGASGKKLYWGHARTVIIGSGAYGRIDEILDTVLRAQDVYLDIAPVIAKNTSAEAVMSAETENGRDASENIFNTFANEKNSRRWKSRRVWQILREHEKNGVYILPTVEVTEKKPTVSGGAVIRDGKVTGFLSGDEMLTFSLLTEKGAGGYLPPIELGEGQVSFEILANDVKKRYSENALKIEQSCVLSPAEVRGDITEEQMQRMAKEKLEGDMRKLLDKIKAEGLGDILGIVSDKGKLPDALGAKADIRCDVRISNILGGK